MASVPAAASAQPALASLEASLGASRAIKVTVTGTVGGPGTLAVEAPPLRLALEGPLPAADRISLREVAITGGRVVHVRIAEAAGGRATEAIVALRQGRPAIVWSGRTGLAGDPGERHGQTLVLEDATGDGVPEVLLEQTSEAVSLCGAGRPALFPRALDPRTGELRPVLLNRLRGATGPEIELAGRWESPGPEGPPLATVASFTAASTTPGDAGDALRLSPPLGLSDGDLTTSWAEARGGNGAGEFVTARVSKLAPLRAIAIVASAPGTPAEARARARPTRLRVVLDDRRFRVRFPGDPAEQPGRAVWVVLPEPVETGCLALVLDESAGPARAPVEIAEVQVYSSLDFGGGTDALVAGLQRPGAEGEEAAQLLARAGDRGAAALAQALPSLGGRARALAVRILADHHGPASLQALVAVLGDDDDAVAAGAVRGLSAAGEAAVAIVSSALRTADGALARRAAAVLGRIAVPEALEALVQRAGARADDEVATRRALREAIALAAGRLGERATPVLTAAVVSDGQRRRGLEVARALDPSRADHRELIARVLEAPAPAAPFAERVQTTRLMGRLCEAGDARFVDALVRVVDERTSDATNEIHRAEALEALGRCGVRAAEALARSLEDPAPRVRGAAISASARAGAKTAAARLARVARQDGWAFLRAAAIEALVAVSPTFRRETIAAALRDRAASVRRTGVRLAAQLRVGEVADAIAARAGDSGEEAEVRIEAVMALGQLCARRHAGTVKRLARMGHRPDANDAEMAAASAAVETLGRLGGPIADEEIRAAARPSSPPALRMAAQRARRAPRCQERRTW